MLRQKRPSPPQIILHIGSTKTGSSALQEAFWRNRRALARQGVLYPAIGIVDNAHHLIAAAGHPHAWMMHRDALPGDDVERAALLRDMLREASDQARGMGAGAILLSSEYFWGVFPDERMALFNEVLSGHPVRIVAFLREPVAWLKSSWLQAVKSGETRSFDAWWQAAKSDRIKGLNYYAVLKSWQESVSAESVLTILYDDVRDDVFAAFLGALGLRVPRGATLNRVNLSPDADGAERLLALNRGGSDIGGAEERAHVMRRHAARATEVDDLPDDLVARIRDDALAWHDDLSAEFLGGKRLF